MSDVLDESDSRQAPVGIAADGREDATSFTLEFDLPGVDPDSIDVQAEDGVLTIQGRRPTREPAEGERPLFAERPTGAFVRRLKFPKSADMTSISAHYALGVLNIRVAKIAPAQPRRVMINVDTATKNSEQKPVETGVVENHS